MLRHCVSSVISLIIWPESVCFIGKVAVIPIAGVDEAVRGVIVAMGWVTLRHRVRETKTGEAVCASLQTRRGFAGNEDIR